MSVDQDFSNMVLALTKHGGTVIADLTPYSAAVWHMCTGMCTELGELLQALAEADSPEEVNIDNFREELGDLEFYLEGFRQVTGLSHDPAEGDAYVSDEPTELLFGVTQMLTYAKALAIYGRPLDPEKVRDELNRVDRGIRSLLDLAGISREEVLRENIRKLSARYPSKVFTTADALARADKPAGQ